MRSAIDGIAALGILPVINLEKQEYALPLAKALCAGGIPAIEITLRSNDALSSIKIIKNELPDMIVGSGTVLTREQVDASLEAGADFIVSPGFSTNTVSYCIDRKIPIIPGCITASEIETGIEAGISEFKFFPSEQMGGINTINLLGGPFGSIRFIPTGGLDYHNLSHYLQNEKVLACGGSFMAKSDLIRSGAWDEITRLCIKAMDISLGFTLAHIGINHTSEEDALSTARMFSERFRLPVKVGNSSVFAGSAVECMKMPFCGEMGHIGFYTNSLVRAEAYFLTHGFSIDENSYKYDNKGNVVSFYLKEYISGFAVHVVKYPK